MGYVGGRRGGEGGVSERGTWGGGYMKGVRGVGREGRYVGDVKGVSGRTGCT